MINFGLSCNSLLLYTYHAIVHCFLTNMLFSKKRLYGLGLYPFFWSILLYILYHNNANSMQPQISCNRSIYIYFPPFSYLRFALCSGLMSHIMSTNCHHILSRTILYLDIYACRQAPGTPDTAIPLLFYA